MVVIAVGVKFGPRHLRDVGLPVAIIRRRDAEPPDQYEHEGSSGDAESYVGAAQKNQSGGDGESVKGCSGNPQRGEGKIEKERGDGPDGAEHDDREEKDQAGSPEHDKPTRFAAIRIQESFIFNLGA